MLNSHLQLLKQSVLSDIPRNLYELPDFDELLLILGRLLNRLLHYLKSVLDVINSVVAPLFNRLNHSVAQF